MQSILVSNQQSVLFPDCLGMRPPPAIVQPSWDWRPVKWGYIVSLGSSFSEGLSEEGLRVNWELMAALTLFELGVEGQLHPYQCLTHAAMEGVWRGVVQDEFHHLLELLGVVWEDEVLATCLQLLKELCLHPFLHLVRYYGNKTKCWNVQSHDCAYNITAKYSYIITLIPRLFLASFPGSARSSLAVRNSLREFVNFVQQATNAQGLVTRLGSSPVALSQFHAWDWTGNEAKLLMYFTRSKAHHYSRNFTSVWHHNDIIILGGHMSVREVSRCECCEAYVAETRAPRDMPTRWRFCRSIPSINWRVSGRDRGRLCVWREREREREMMGCFALGGVKSSLLHGIWYASCG